MQPIIMQDWITIRGTSTTQSIAQSQAGWVDTAAFQDVSFYLDVREFTGTTPQMVFETAPSRDEALFQAMLAAFNVATGTTVKNALLASATVPVSNWTRWRLSGPAATPWDVTFRIMASGNSLG